MRAAGECPPLIGLIDGVFMHELPPSPHEVLRVLQQGVPVLGSSSLGALRAVELAPFGMVGIGRVYEWFQTGVLDADDEVALVFHAERLNAISEPMVNIRHALAEAVRAGVLAPCDEQTLIRVGKELYFPDRSWKRLLREARDQVATMALDALERFVRGTDLDLKARDARLLLEEAARSMRNRYPAVVPAASA
jgi:hypothetical protein